MFSVSQAALEIIVLVCALLIAILIACLVMSILNTVRLRRIMKNCSSGKLDETITLYYNKINELSDSLDKKTERFEQIEKMIRAGVQKFAVVHYDAFNDITNNLSFSIALLDAEDTGFILTSIYGRNSSNLYIKSILKGKSNATMSDEEIEAFERALSSYENKLK